MFTHRPTHRALLAGLTVAASLLLTMTGCGSPTSPSNTGDSTMTAKINGTSWTAASAKAIRFPSNVISVAGADATQSLGFSIVATGTGTYPTPGAAQTQIGNNAIYIVNPDILVSPSWTADINVGGSGSVTITSFTDTTISGTFSFSLVANPGTGSTGTKSITNGTFNAKFQAGD